MLRLPSESFAGTGPGRGPVHGHNASERTKVGFRQLLYRQSQASADYCGDVTHRNPLLANGVPRCAGRCRFHGQTNERRRIRFTDTPMLTAHDVRHSWGYYLGAGMAGTADVSPYAAPARATDLAGLPPTFITACEFDPLRDESLNYALRLIASSVPTCLIHYPGTFHGSHFISADISRRMIADQLAAIRRGLHGITIADGALTTTGRRTLQT